jgi:cell division protein FtsB
MKSFQSSGSRTRAWWGLGVFLVGVLVWVLFFDSHSLLQRYHWQQELNATQRENETLRNDIEQLRTQLDRPLSDSAVKRIAREEYGMKRPGETIYRIETE